MRRGSFVCHIERNGNFFTGGIGHLPIVACLVALCAGTISGDGSHNG